MKYKNFEIDPVLLIIALMLISGILYALIRR